MSTKHDGMTPGELARRREAQHGLCYLCGDPLPADRYFLAIDHDHRHCPPKTSCVLCRRGLTCHSCNVLIGHAKDDPDRLERIASNLRAARTAAARRIATQPVLFEPGERARVKRPRTAAQPRPQPPGTLADVLKIFKDDKGLHWQVVAERLTGQFPDRWAEVTADVISAQCRALGVPSMTIRYPTGRRGKNLRGCRKADIIGAMTGQTPLVA